MKLRGWFKTVEVAGQLYAITSPAHDSRWVQIEADEGEDEVEVWSQGDIFVLRGDDWEVVTDIGINQHIWELLGASDPVKLEQRFRDWIEEMKKVSPELVFVNKGGLTEVCLSKSAVRQMLAPKVSPNIWKLWTNRTTGRLTKNIDPPIYWADIGKQFPKKITPSKE